MSLAHAQEKESHLKYELVKQASDHNIPKEYLKSIINLTKGKAK